MAERKQYPKALKREVIATVKAGAASPAEVAREYKLDPQLIYKWVAAAKKKKKKAKAITSKKADAAAPHPATKTAGTSVVINGVSVTVRGRQVTISY